MWSHDFVHCRPDDGKAFRTLNVNDGHSRECLAIEVERKQNSTDVIGVLRELFILLILRGAPGFRRSDNGKTMADNGPEFVAQAVRDWIAAVGAKTAYIDPGGPWENGNTVKASMGGSGTRSSSAKHSETFYNPREARIPIGLWRIHDTAKRPHSALGDRPPPPETVVPVNLRANDAPTIELARSDVAAQE